MENAACNVIYVDRSVCEDRLLRSSDLRLTDSDVRETGALRENVDILLTHFSGVHLCASGAAGLSKLLELQDSLVVDLKPTLILVETAHDDRLGQQKSRSRSPSPHSQAREDDEAQSGEEELCGLALVQRLVSEAYMRNISRLVIVVPVVEPPPEPLDRTDGSGEADDHLPSGMLLECVSPPRRAANRRFLKRCLDLGATDVMASPMNKKCIINLEVHCYRAHRDVSRDQKSLLAVRRGKRRSWVGLTEEKPFSYLREAMVSNLMNRICRMNGAQDDDRISSVKLLVSSEGHARVAQAVGRWHFDAHQFSEDELVTAASIMFRHALSLPELEKWRIPTEQLEAFIIACRVAYNSFVPYHNFRHVVDVMQATFSFLIHLGVLPPYPAPTEGVAVPPAKSPIVSLLKPFEALTLLVVAIGHDVGHPGVNNGFLTKLNAPLAQLYNDRSVLESFHCAAYSQILRRHWPSVFRDHEMRNLMISAILATDMGLHFDYMKKMGDVQGQLREQNSTDAWNDRMVEEQKTLACSLLIKCADISNVARQYETALKWMHILSDEFSRQAAMEQEVDIPTSLMGQQKHDIVSLSKAQLGFMNLFAIPLFQGVADLMPSLRYCVDELEVNKARFEQTVAQETEGHVQSPSQKATSSSPQAGDSAVPAALATPASPKPLGEIGPSPALRLQADRQATEKEFDTARVSPAQEPSHLPVLSGEYKEVNGTMTSFDAVADFAASDPFHSNDGGHGQAARQRRSQTTEGSTSAPCSGDWASQATSATTGRMPLSPSTQGTSIVSRDSSERPLATVAAVPSAKQPLDVKIEEHGSDESCANGDGWPHDDGTGGGNGVVVTDDTNQDKALKKRPSRFRINGLPFFRKHKGASPPLPAANTAG